MSKHERCGERLDCPCWLDGAREEGEMHRSRITTRQVTDYIRALGDNDPAMTEQDIADAVYRVYGSSSSPAPAGLDVPSRTPEQHQLADNLLDAVEAVLDPSLVRHADRRARALASLRLAYDDVVEEANRG